MRVGLFVTCVVDLMRPEIGFSALKLLKQAGCDVVVPPAQTCCGQPAYNSGERAIARDLAEKTLAEFESLDYVVVPSGSCGGMIRVHYGELFRDDPELMARYGRLRTKVYELTDFLVNVARVTLERGAFKGPVTYHDSCSGLRELGVKAQPRALLAQRGVAVAEMKDCEHCCGFGGTFA
ncbi:(Fe-S)-binding protein, partial [Burkholderia pseudomallei]